MKWHTNACNSVIKVKNLKIITLCMFSKLSWNNGGSQEFPGELVGKHWYYNRFILKLFTSESSVPVNQVILISWYSQWLCKTKSTCCSKFYSNSDHNFQLWITLWAEIQQVQLSRSSLQADFLIGKVPGI